MRIRPAAPGDLDNIMRVYDEARRIMRQAGNDKQWINGYPQRSMIEDDIEAGQSFVIEGDDGMPHGVFMFAAGDDPTYDVIEDGAWPDDDPYGAIHRIGSDGTLRGIVPAAVEYCLQTVDAIRIDTHADNAIMHHVLTKCGFVRCGTIYCQDGTPRIAYQLTRR